MLFRSKIPYETAEEDLEHLLLFVPADKQETVRDAYEESKDTYEYDGTVMRLKSDIRDDEDRCQELSDILGRPMLLCTGFDMGSESVVEMETQMEEKLSSMPETMVEQAAAVYIENIYKKLGIDIDRKETGYILETGAKMLALAALGMIASILVGLLSSRVGAHVGQGLRRDVFRNVVGFSSGEFDKFSTASLITRSTNDIQQIQLLTVMILRMVLYAPILAAGGIFKVDRKSVV